MADPFLQSYSGQSTEELLALEGQYRTDSLVLAFEEAIQQKSQPSVHERYVLAIESLEREVNNGGYSQFFLNLPGEFGGIVESALRAIDCPKTADITRDAIAVIVRQSKGDLSADALSHASAEADGATVDALGECDGRYFSNDEPIADRLFQWIKANKATIRIGNV